MELSILCVNIICDYRRLFFWPQDPTGTMGPYAYWGNQWVGYDDAAMAAVKTRWAVSQGFGGVMVWDVNSEDVR